MSWNSQLEEDIEALYSELAGGLNRPAGIARHPAKKGERVWLQTSGLSNILFGPGKIAHLPSGMDAHEAIKMLKPSQVAEMKVRIEPPNPVQKRKVKFRGKVKHRGKVW